MVTRAEIREFSRADTSRVADLLSTNFALLPAIAWEEGLAHILWNNPNSVGTAPMGWVLDHPDEGIVGFLGNVLHPFHVVDREVRAASTTAWCVAPRHRSLGLLLAEAFLEQEGADILFNTTANQIAGELFLRLGFQQVPTGWFWDVLYWVARPAHFLRGAAVHLTGSRAMGAVAAVSGTIPLATLESLRGLGQKQRSAVPLELSVLEVFGDEWQHCWDSWRKGLITGVRTPQQMRWRLACDDGRSFCVRGPGAELLGYATCRLKVDHRGSLLRLRIMDLWAKPGRPDVIRRIVEAAKELAVKWRCGSLEVCGMSENVRESLAPLRPRHRRMSAWPYYIRARDHSLAAELEDPKRWHPTEYDGDSPFGSD